jgi:hypothetical protein
LAVLQRPLPLAFRGGRGEPMESIKSSTDSKTS